MAKGTIYSGGEKGKYQVEIDSGEEIRDSLIEERDARRTVLEGLIANLETQIAEIELTVEQDILNVSNNIAVYNASKKTPEDEKLLEESSSVAVLNAASLRRNKSALSDLLYELATAASSVPNLSL